MSDRLFRLCCATMLALPLLGLTPAYAAVKPFFPRNPPETVEPAKPAKA